MPQWEKSIQHSLENALLQTSTLELFRWCSFPCDMGLDIISVVRGHQCNNLSGESQYHVSLVSPSPTRTPHLIIRHTQQISFQIDPASGEWADHAYVLSSATCIFTFLQFTTLPSTSWRQRISNDTFNFKPCCQ